MKNTWTPENSQAIGLLDSDGALAAGIWYQGYNKTSINCHMAITGSLTRYYLHVIFHYPFMVLGVKKMIASVVQDNLQCIRMVRKMGFKEEARLKDISPTGDVLFFVLNKEDCRYLENKYGRNTRRR